MSQLSEKQLSFRQTRCRQGSCCLATIDLQHNCSFDRANGRAYGTTCHPSVCLSVMYAHVSRQNGTLYGHRESTMVRFDMALVSFYVMSIVTMSLSAAVWSQFATEVHLGALPEVYVLSKLCK